MQIYSKNLKVIVASSRCTMNCKNAMMGRKISNQYKERTCVQSFFKGEYALNEIPNYCEMIGRVNVRIVNQFVKVRVNLDSSGPTGTEMYAICDGTNDIVFKRDHATLCVVASDSDGIPRIHIRYDTNAKTSTMETETL